MAGRDIVVVGGSAGSIEVVRQLVRGLPPNFPAAVFVVVHFPAAVPSTLPRILSRAGSLPARHARDGEAIKAGRAQSLDSALYPSMPRSAIDHVAVDHVLPPAGIASMLAELALKPASSLEVPSMPDDLSLEEELDYT
jgi:chemotaxis response regulator CheB